MNTGEFIEKFLQADVKTLALQGNKYPDVDLPFALEQIAGWQMARQKLPKYAALKGILYPHHLSMEQCSSELTARQKARIVASSTDRCSLMDLTAGFGIDFSFMAPLFQTATYVEQQEYLCDLARHNFPLLELNHATVIHGNGVEILGQTKPVDWIFLDPARRDRNGGKVVAVKDCEPDVEALEPLLLEQAKHVMVKLSPMLDINLAISALKHVHEVHVIAVNGECKELLLILGRTVLSREQISICSVNLQKEEQIFTFSLGEEETASCFLGAPSHFLYEPNAALIKAGGFKSIMAQFAVRKLHANSHLYTSEQLIPDFPGRIFEIEKVCGFSKKELKELQALKKANLTVRNFPQSVADLRKRLKLAEGGDHYLFATTLNSNEKALILGHKAIKG